MNPSASPSLLSIIGSVWGRIVRPLVLPLLVLAGPCALNAQVLTSLGTTAPSADADDIAQLSTGGTVSPDGLNYFTDNSAPAAQTFTTGAEAKRLVSVALKTAGLNSGNGYGTPASTPTLYLRIYEINGASATLLITLSAPNPGYTDGAWLQWTGIKVPLQANKTYAYSFGSKPTAGGWAALAVAAGDTYAGGEIALIPIAGGTVTTGASHGYDAAFVLGLEDMPVTPADTPLPMPTYGFNIGNGMEAVWGYAYPDVKVFYNAANAGFNAVRMPCAWDSQADDTTYEIDPTYMAKVKLAVDQAIAAGMHVLINIHWDGGWMENNIGDSVDPIIEAKLIAYWTQIATTFADYDNRLLFAAANEPSAHNPAEFATLMAYYKTFIDTVRGVGGGNTDRWLVLQGGGDTAWFTTMPADPTPGRLMVEYHNYTPSLFTIIHEDQSWGNTIYFWGAAYQNPATPGRGAVWPAEGWIDSGYQQLTDQYVSKGIPVLIGEMQAARKSYLTGDDAAYNRASTLYWNKYAVDSAHAHGLSPFYWSTGNSPFNYETGEIVDADVVRVLTGGIAPPPPNGAPYAVTGVTATAGTGQVALSWDAVEGATSYDLYRTAQSGYEPATPSVTGITGTSYTDTGLNGGTTYYYQVVAVNASGQSGFSTEAYATTPGVNPDPTQFHFETDTQRWRTNGDQISGIETSATRAYAGQRSLAVNFNGSSAGTSSVLLDGANVLAGSTITFRVWIPGGSAVTMIEPYSNDYNWAWNSSWFGNLSANAWNTVTLTIPTTRTTPLRQLGLRMTTNAAWTGTCYIDSISWPLPSAPAAPTGLVAQASAGRVDLSWSSADTATSYRIKRSTTSGGAYATIATTAELTHADAGVTNGTTYYYVVSALNSEGESPDSAEVAATPAELNALYAFEGDTQDTSGVGNHGTANAITYVAGKVGAQAAQFNGTSSYVSIPRSVTEDFTVTMWVKTTDTGGWSGAQWWNGKGLVDGEVGGGGADWGTAIVNGKFAFGVGSASSGDTTIATSVNINDGAWHHLAATRDNTTGAVALYVDGVLRGGGTGPTGARTLPPGLRIGSLQTGGGFLNGTLDDVRLYSRILSESELAALAAGPQPPAAPENLGATPGTAAITLSWDAADGATDYVVRRSALVGGPFTQIATGITTTGYEDTGLADGATWYYTVSANGAAGQGPESAPVSATTFTELENWRAEHFGTTADSGDAADAADPDGDGWTNLDEYIAGTGPNDPASLFKIAQLQAGDGEFTITFPSALGRTYTVERSYTLETGSWVALPGETPGTGETLPVTDTDPTESPRRFYRVVVTL